MKVRYLGASDPLELLHGKVYDVVSIEEGWYRIVDETGEDYLYPPQAFEIVEHDDGITPVPDKGGNEETQCRGEFMPTLDMFEGISLRGRFAYACLCIESRLRDETPDADWTSVARILWEFADGKIPWDAWADHLLHILPSVYAECPDYETFSNEGYELDKQDYAGFKSLVGTLNSKASSMIESFYEMVQECEGTNAQHGIDSSAGCFLDILQGLDGEGASFPAVGDVAFLVAADEGGYGLPFNGTFLSEILETECAAPYDFPNHCAKCGGDISITYEPMLQAAVCERCGEIAIATYWEPIDEDQTEYSLVVSAKNGTEPETLRIVAQMTGMNYLQAKKELEQGDVIAFAGKAKSVAHRAAKLLDEGVSFSITPDFPYPIPYEWGMGSKATNPEMPHNDQGNNQTR